MSCGRAPRSRPSPDLRVSDAERAAVAERLSKHYADGRLDEAEFNERVDATMKAKRQADFNGLFSDLPDLEQPGALSRTQRDHAHHGLLLLVAVVVVAIGVVAVTEALVRPAFPWLLIGLFVFLWLRHSHWHHRHL